MGQIVLETDGSGTVIDRYMRGAGGRLIRSDRHGWYLHDRQGSVVQRTSNQGVVLHSYRFTAFGNELIAPNGVESGNPFRFQSMYWDSHTQTYYTPNRHYNPRTGRWLSPDPHWDIRTNAIFGDSPTIRNDRNVPSIHAILQAGNLYAFVMHNPVRWIDPLGLFAEDKNPADKKIEDATHGALAPRDPRTRRVFRLGSGRGTSGGGRSNASGGGNTTGGRVSSVRDSGRRFVGRITGRGTATTNQAPVANTQAPVNTAVQAPAATSNIAPQRGVGGVGWRGDATWRGNVNTIGSGGTITNLNGRMDCQHILRQKR